VVTTDALEGTINGTLSYHYDVAGDVLYLRRIAEMDTPALGEESSDGFIELRAEASGEVIGLTIVNWWKRFGRGALPDSITAIHRAIEPIAAKIAA